MPLRVVQLGSPRHKDEGTRIGTVRRPPRGVPKTEFSRRDWYDVWFPNLAPSIELMKLGQAAASEREWKAFLKQYKTEMSAPDRRRDIELLAALSQTVNLSVGCYCHDEARCHRSALRELLAEAGAKLAPSGGESAA